MVLLIPAAGILFYLALFLVALVLLGIFWGIYGLIIGLTHVTALATRRKSRPKAPRKTPVSPKRKVPPAPDRAPRPAPAPASPDIWPKWTPAHRRYVDEELAIWQEQFDALNSRK